MIISSKKKPYFLIIFSFFVFSLFGIKTLAMDYKKSSNLSEFVCPYVEKDFNNMIEFKKEDYKKTFQD